MLLKNARMAAILPAANLERAKKFYAEKLGLESTDTGAPATVYIECGGDTAFLLYERAGGTKAEHTVAGWMVDDVVETVKELNQKGVVFEQYDRPGLKTDAHGIAMLGEEKAAWFKDSEGNILAITESLD